MKKYLLVCLAVLIATTAQAEQKKRFALVPKFMNHPFFAQAHEGCKAFAAEHPEAECIFIGPAEPDEAQQVQIVQDLITQGIDGIAISPMNAPAVAKTMKRLAQKKIPIVTWDSDFLPKDRDLRLSYVGTHNSELGREMGRQLLALRPQGGSYAIQSGGAASDNLNERIAGIREVLTGSAYTEVSGSPLFCNDDSALSVKQLEDLLTRIPNLNAFLPVGGWPQTAHSAYRKIMERQKTRLDKKELVVVSADTLPMQLKLLKEGLSHAQVGQKPFLMGKLSLETLLNITKGEKVQEIVYTELEVVK